MGFKNHWSGKKKIVYTVIVEGGYDVQFNSRQNAEEYKSKMKKRGYKIKIKTHRINLGEQYREVKGY